MIGTSCFRDDLPRRIEPAAAVGKFYVRQNEFGLAAFDGGECFRLRRRDVLDRVAETADDRLEVHRNQQFILDDENVGGHLMGYLLAGNIEKALDVLLADFENALRPPLQ